MVKGVRKEQKGIEYYMALPYSILLHQVEEGGKNYWMAEVPQLPGCRSHGSTVEEAVTSVEEAKKDWILDSLEEGEEIPLPVDDESYSGRFILRMSRSLHRALSVMAENEGLSLNQLVVTILAKEVGRLSILNRVEQKIDNVLDKINDVIEERRDPFSKWSHLLMQPYEAEQYFVVGTTPNIELKATPDASIFSRWVVSTASPFEELQSSLSPHPSRWSRIAFSSIKAMEDEAAEIEQK